MTGSYLTNPIVFLVEVVFWALTLVVLLRFLLQLLKASYYNPVSRFVVKVTTPMLRPLRRVVPGYAGMDLAALVLAWLLKSLELALLALLLSPALGAAGSGAHGFGLLSALAWAVPELVTMTVNIFLFAVIVRAVVSWFNPDPHHPMVSLLDSLTEPLLRPVRRSVPPIEGLDLSPFILIVALGVFWMLVVPPLRGLTGVPAWLIGGF